MRGSRAACWLAPLGCARAEGRESMRASGHATLRHCALFGSAWPCFFKPHAHTPAPCAHSHPGGGCVCHALQLLPAAAPMHREHPRILAHKPCMPSMLRAPEATLARCAAAPRSARDCTRAQPTDPETARPGATPRVQPTGRFLVAAGPANAKISGVRSGRSGASAGAYLPLAHPQGRREGAGGVRHRDLVQYASRSDRQYDMIVNRVQPPHGAA